jgi:hypothetical protein
LTEAAADFSPVAGWQLCGNGTLIPDISRNPMMSAISKIMPGANSRLPTHLRHSIFILHGDMKVQSVRRFGDDVGSG